MRAADHVFESLSRAILNGQIPPGSVLATQRELSAQFGVSPLVVRQATHRLEELGLVCVRQGSTTTVLDPNTANDVRLIQLRLELATIEGRLAGFAHEAQAYSALPILALAERRITEAEIDALAVWIATLPDELSLHEARAFRRKFWAALVRASRNPVLERQVNWWARVMQELEARGGGAIPSAHKRNYLGLLRALRKRRGACEYWQKVIAGLSELVEANPRMRELGGDAGAAEED
jgi:DNA-binding FadR family transcriptional regulator